MKKDKGNKGLKLYLKEHKQFSWLLTYTGLFVVLSIAVYGWLFLNGKSAVWTVDGIPQHFNVMMYIRSWIRQILSTLISEGKLVIPMFDLSIGQGNDILTTFHYYGFTDPFNWVAVIFPSKLVEVYYTALALFRIWASGLGFGYFCLARKKSRYATLVGALVYSFSYWSIAAGTRHPFFIIPMMYFPLILAGIDKIFAGRRPYLFIITVALAAMSNFYFFYMLCLFMFIYAVFRYITVFKKLRFVEVVKWLGKFIGYFAVALCSVAVTLLPFALAILTSTRAQAQNYLPLLYPIDYYQKFLTAFIGGEAGNWTELGFTGFGLFAVILLFAAKKKRTELKIGFILMSAVMLIPAFGYAVNGFSYVCNRGSWAYAMLVAYVVTETLPELLHASAQKKRVLAVATAVYIAIGVAFANGRAETGLVCSALAALSMVVLFAFWEKKQLLRRAIIVMVCVCLAAQGSLRFAFVNDNYTANVYADLGSANNLLGSFSPTNTLAGADGAYNHRYDQYGTGDVYNTGLSKGLYSCSHYWSLANASLEEFSREMYFNHTYDHMYEGFDSRIFVDTAFSVGYFIAKNGKYVPKGFEEISSAERGNKIYKNTNALGLVYKFNSVISREDYEAMTVTQKQQAILQGAVVEGVSELDTLMPEFYDKIPDTELKLSDGIEVRQGYIDVTEAGATITFTFEGTPDSETYFIIEGLDYSGRSPAEIAAQSNWSGYTSWYKNKTLYDSLFWKEIQSISISVSTENATKELSYATPKDNFYTGRHNFLVNLGYTEEAVNEVTVRFPAVGTYSYSDMKIVCQSLEMYEEWVDGMKANTAGDVEIATNSISATVNSDGRELVCFSVPYSKGWSATVNGKPAEIIKTNTMFMSVLVEAGENNIELTYTTPMINYALVLSLVGLVAFAAVVILNEIKLSKKRKEQTK